jgi:hypothetical protein
MVYLLEFGGGCQDCETPAGVIVQQVSKKATEWTMFAEGELPLKGIKGEGKAYAIPLADAGEITDLVIKLICDGFGVKDFYEIPRILSDKLDPDELRLEIYDYLKGKVYEAFNKNEVD